MGLKRLLGMGHRSAGVGDAVLQAFQDSLLGGSAAQVDPSATAAVETAVRALSSPYGVSTVTGPSVVTPAFLVDLARRLFTCGNAVYRIDVDGDGLDLVAASSFDVGGSAGHWVYSLETPQPGDRKADRRRVSADGVVHVKINAPSSEPWRGRAPWQIASASARTYASIERSLGMDSSVVGGMIMPQPDGASPKSIKEIQAALTTGKGGLTLVETTAQGFGQGITSAPKQDWEEKRFGALIPEFNTILRESSAAAIMQAFGVSQAMFSGDGNAMREARRLMFLDSILPTSALIAQELTSKLETPVSIGHEQSEHLDSQRLGRFLKSLVDAGYSLPDASNIVGLPRA